MRLPNPLRSVLILGTTGILTGCAGSAPSPVVAPPVASDAVRAPHSGSWMSPEAKKQTSLLYVSNWGTGDVTVYTYLNGGGLVLVGTLTGFSTPAGLCTDSAGDVFIPSYGSRQIFEYAHGGTTPIFTIDEHSGFPFDCADDPATGNLAVANQHPNGKYQAFGNVAVYLKGSKSGIAYTTPYGFSEVYFVAYDNKSNLYLDASPCDPSSCYYGGGPPGLYRLADGASSFAQITLKGGTLHEPAAINWINPTLLLGDQNFEKQGESGAYKIFVSGSTATVVGSLPFAGTQQAYGFSRRAGRVVVPDHTENAVRIYNLSDGSLFTTLTTEISAPFGAVVSQSS